MTISIAIVDDHKLFLDGLLHLIKRGLPNAKVKDYSNAADFLNQQESYDVVLLDVIMDGINGIDVAAKLLDSNPTQKIIMLTMQEDLETIDRATELSISGFVLKNCAADDLIDAIDQVMSGKTYFSPKVVDQMLYLMKHKAEKKEAEEQLEVLSEREMEILGLVTRQFSSKEIAEKLYLSIHTVNTHRKNILRKVGAKNTAGLIKYYLESLETN